MERPVALANDNAAWRKVPPQPLPVQLESVLLQKHAFPLHSRGKRGWMGVEDHQTQIEGDCTETGRTCSNRRGWQHPSHVPGPASNQSNHICGRWIYVNERRTLTYGDIASPADLDRRALGVTVCDISGHACNISRISRLCTAKAAVRSAMRRIFIACRQHLTDVKTGPVAQDKHLEPCEKHAQGVGPVISGHAP